MFHHQTSAPVRGGRLRLLPASAPSGRVVSSPSFVHKGMCGLETGITGASRTEAHPRCTEPRRCQVHQVLLCARREKRVIRGGVWGALRKGLWSEFTTSNHSTLLDQLGTTFGDFPFTDICLSLTLSLYLAFSPLSLSSLSLSSLSLSPSLSEPWW